MFRPKINYVTTLVLTRTQTLRRTWRRAWSLLRNTFLDLFVFTLAGYRALILRGPIFIGVTGSCGKTMTKELTNAVLASRLRGTRNPNTSNTLRQVTRTLLRVRRSDDYCVHEVSIGKYSGRLTLAHTLRPLRPTIGVVTNVGTDHLSIFGSKQAIAAEKRKLVAGLPGDGVAILNSDDPLVMEMATHCMGRVVTYGVASDASVRATNVSCEWPQRLAFTVHVGDETYPVQTQLCGTQWVHSVLAAMAVGLSMGIPLQAAVEAVSRVPPFRGRMSPEEVAPGVVFVNDAWKAPILSFPPALEFLKRAKAKRKIVIVGTISDYWGDSKGKYVQIARQALAVADQVFFVGPMAPHCLAAKKRSTDTSLQVFESVHDLAEHLRAFLQQGDLVLVKGSPKDRLPSITKRLKQDVEPALPTAIEASEMVLEPSPVGAFAGHGETAVGPSPAQARPFQLVIGLGNPSEEYENTRHNVGRRVVDMLAARLEAHWRQEGDAMVALVEKDGRSILLVKLLTSMNTSGSVLRQLAKRLGVEASDCILVYDDMDLPIGKIRERLRGSAGGHKGVLSIITSFQSAEFRRVKIGVGQPPEKQGTAAFVLSAFSTSEEPAVRSAVVEACSRIMRLLAEHRAEVA